MPSPSDRPNILLLHTDQQRFDTINALGHTHVDTPNIDRLVRRGTVFCNAYSSNPVCMPARHDLLTGASARYHGYYSNSRSYIKDHRVATVPRILTQAGYQTLAVGKVHNNPEREHHGYAHMYLMEELPSCRENDAYLQYLELEGWGHIRCQHGVRPLFYHTPQVARVPEEHHGSAWIAHRAIDLIRQDRDRPFFLFASWVGPHPPYYVPESYLTQYQGRELPPPCPSNAISDRHTPPSPENATGARLQAIREAYFAAISLIDTHLGRILDALEESGKMDNTLILFTSDHGEMLGDRGGYQKHMPYEGSAHIPLIACGPGFEPGIFRTPVTTWDTAATVLKSSGAIVPENHPLMGKSLDDAAKEGDGRTVVFHHGASRGRYVAAVGKGHKFVHWYNGGEEELYDLGADPWEADNLLEFGAGTSLADELRQACIQFESESGAAENVNGRQFADSQYQAPNAHACSLHPPWSSFQFPPWMNGYSKEDLEAIENEMRDCLKNEHAFIHKEPEWREDAVKRWKEIGGDPKVYEDIFRRADGELPV